MSDTPYLSIVVTGRNDDFGGDFNGRFFRALRFNHRELSARGIPHEFVLAEWRPLDGRPWLATVLADTFPDLAPHVVHSVVADAAYHTAFSLNPRLQFQEFIAKNVGVRHARGAFVLTTNTDIYLGRHVLAQMADRALEAGTLYRAMRLDLHPLRHDGPVEWADLEDPEAVEQANAIRPPYFTNASGDFLLLDRASYERIRGFNEVYRVAKIHMDSNFCFKAAGAGIAIVDIGGPVYHLGQGTLHQQRDLYQARPQDAPWGNLRWASDVVYDNPEGWGLAFAPAAKVAPHTTFLEFDWRAVPRLADLRRLALPPSRVTTQVRA